MKTKNKKISVPILFKSPMTSSGTHNIESKRHNTKNTFSINFYKSICKYDIK